MLEHAQSSARRVSHRNCMLDYSLGWHFLDDMYPALNKQSNETDKAKMKKRVIVNLTLRTRGMTLHFDFGFNAEGIGW